MAEIQEIVAVTEQQLLELVKKFAEEKHRLVLISCTQVGNLFRIDYGFDLAYKFCALRIEVPINAPKLPSISPIYFAAFLYENELHDLFGISFAGLLLDYCGKFYRIEKQTPFRTEVNSTETTN